MLKKDVAKHFDGKQVAAGKVGASAATFSAWGDKVPELYAHRYHKITRGKLRFDWADYPWVEAGKPKAPQSLNNK